VIDHAQAGEHLKIAVEQTDVSCRVSITRPTALRDLSDSLLFEGVSTSGIQAGTSLSAGFSLRLVRGLARIAGGDLTTSPASLTLVFPRVT
jgi:hypothetical protein